MTGRAERQTNIREITSAANPLLKVFRRALSGGVTRDGWLAVEGPLILEEALAAAPRAEIHCVLVAKGSKEKFGRIIGRLASDTEIACVSERLFRRVAATASPQGIAALVELRHWDFDSILSRPDALLLIACGLQDPGNLGTIVRSAQALGATALLTLKKTVSPFNPKAVRSSAGAIFRLPLFRDLEPASLFDLLRGAGIRILAADRSGPATLVQADLRGPVALLIGQEASGLPEEVTRDANQVLSIPIRHGMDSVNAATAAGIFLYEAARQRGFKHS